MSGPYDSDPYRAGPGPNPPEPTRQFGPPGGMPYSPGGYPPAGGYPPPGGPTPPGPYGPGGPGEPPPGRNRGPWIGGAAAVVVLIVVGLILFFTVGHRGDTSVASPTTTTATTVAPAPTTTQPSAPTRTRATAVPPLPSSLAPTTATSSPPSSTTPSTPVTPTPGGGDATVAANPEQTQQITALSKALVDGISKGDRAALKQITCGKLASTLDGETDEPDPTVYDHVDHIMVSPDGTTGTVEIFAYTVKRGPPAKAVTFTLQKQGSAWKACDFKD